MDDASITSWLSRLRSGDAAALDQLLPLVYDDLRSLARARIRNEDTGHTLGATALVHEAYLRIAERQNLAPQDRRHFLGIAVQSMRRVLIDHARARKRQKRGSGRTAVPLDDVAAFLTEEVADELLCLDDALARLAGANARAAQVVERRFFAGLTLEEVAEVMGISAKTAHRDWTLARAWLRKEIAAARPTTRTSALDEIDA